MSQSDPPASDEEFQRVIVSEQWDQLTLLWRNKIGRQPNREETDALFSVALHVLSEAPGARIIDFKVDNRIVMVKLDDNRSFSA